VDFFTLGAIIVSIGKLLTLLTTLEGGLENAPSSSLEEGVFDVGEKVGGELSRTTACAGSSVLDIIVVPRASAFSEL